MDVLWTRVDVYTRGDLQDVKRATDGGGLLWSVLAVMNVEVVLCCVTVFQSS